MENIIINFQSDASGLQPGIDGLVQMEVVDRELADQVKKTAAAMEARNKSMSEGTKKNASEMEKMAASFKGLDKSIVGGAFDKSLKELQTKLEGTTDEFKQLSLTIDFAKKKLATLKPDSADWQELATQISAGEQLLQAFGQAEEQTEKKTVSLRTQLRQLKEEIATRMENGESGPELDALIAKAGDLDDRLKDITATVANVGSDTRNIEGLIEIAGAGVGAFSALQGAMALTGDETEDTQRAMQKLFGVMALLQGIQQIQNALQKESAATLLIENARRQIAVLQTNLQASAESRNIVVKYASVAAQKALNAVMAANPIGIVVVAIGALAAAMLTLSSNTRAAARAQAELNNAMRESGDLLDADLKGIETANRKILAEMKARGASDAQLTRQEIQNNLLRKKARETALAELTKTLNDEKTVRELSAEDYQKLSQKQLELQFAIKEDEADISVQRSEAERRAFEQSLKSATAYSEARVALAKKESSEELQAQIAAIRARTREEVKGNPNITAGEMAKIYAEAGKQIEALNRQFRVTQLQAQKSFIDAQVLMQKEGSKEEFAAKLAQLQIDRDIATASLTDTVNDYKKRALIDAAYYKQRNDLIKAYNRQVAEDAVNGQIAETNARISQLQLQNDAATNAQLLANKKELIDEQAALEIIAINDSVHNEELRRLKIKEVYDRAAADKRELEKQKLQAEISDGLTSIQALYDHQIDGAQRVLQSEKATYRQRNQAAESYYNLIDGKIAAQQLANQQSFDNGLITYSEYLSQKLALDTQYYQNAQDRENAHQQAVNQIRELAAQSAAGLGNVIFNISKKNYDFEESRIEELHQKKLLSDDEYNKQLKKLRRQQSEDEKEQAIFTMLVNQGPTLLKAFQQGGFPAIAAATALFFSILGELTSENVPAYKDGKIRINGPGTETSDSIWAKLSKNESVIKASMSKKHEGALRAINEDRFIPYLMHHELPRLYQNMTMPQLPEYVQSVSNNYNAEPLDYEKLAEVIAQKLAENPQTQINMDERGLSVSVLKNGDRINYVNKKLNL